MKISSCSRALAWPTYSPSFFGLKARSMASSFGDALAALTTRGAAKVSFDLASDGAEGHGLRGMRERVGVYGGELQAGPRPSGGFRVTALLPYGAQESRSAADTAGAAAKESA